jgi:hypothetical protein
MLPTYGRSKTYLPEFIRSAIETSSKERVCFSFCVNGKDTETLKFLWDYDFKGFKMEAMEENHPSLNLAVYYNMIYSLADTRNEPGTVVSQVGDDMEFRTRGWDEKILALINYYRGVGVFWCNDDYIAHERCPVNLFLGRQFVEATEHPFMCEAFSADMIDYIWGKIGKYTQTSHYMPDVHIWHNHNTAKSSDKWDLTFKRLKPVQEEARKHKGEAKAYAHKIAEILLRKGLVGDSIV